MFSLDFIFSFLVWMIVVKKAVAGYFYSLIVNRVDPMFLERVPNNVLGYPSSPHQPLLDLKLYALIP